MMEEELRALSLDTYERAVALATMPDIVRGYEGIKLRNVERYRAEIARLQGSADLPGERTPVTLGSPPSREAAPRSG